MLLSLPLLITVAKPYPCISVFDQSLVANTYSVPCQIFHSSFTNSYRQLHKEAIYTGPSLSNHFLVLYHDDICHGTHRTLLRRGPLSFLFVRRDINSRFGLLRARNMLWQISAGRRWLGFKWTAVSRIPAIQEKYCNKYSNNCNYNKHSYHPKRHHLR